MISPSFLKSGDRVAVVAPAKVVPNQAVKESIAILEGWGLKVTSGKHLFESHYLFAGTDQDRLTDFQNALNDSEIKAVFCARGGYGTVRILDKLNWGQFLKSPKWIIGFSDITYLHGKLHQLGVQSIHGPMPALFSDPNGSQSLEQLNHLLFGLSRGAFWRGSPLNRQGICEGQLIGGNLTILQQLIGCDGDFESTGKVLFIEEVGEYLYHFERMLWHMKRSGKFNNLKGLLVGHLTDMKDNPTPFGLSAEEIVLALTKEYNFPVAFGLPFGHESENHPLIVGAEVRIAVNTTDVNLEYKSSQKST